MLLYQLGEVCYGLVELHRDLLEVDLLGWNWGWVEGKRNCCNLSLEVVEHLGGEEWAYGPTTR